MYDILVYLFENCQQAELAYDRERVAKKLSAAGFEDSDISEALHWLAGVTRAPRAALERLPGFALRASGLTRPREAAKLDAQCRGFLLTLEQSGILDAADARAGDRAGAGGGGRLAFASSSSSWWY